MGRISVHVQWCMSSENESVSLFDVVMTCGKLYPHFLRKPRSETGPEYAQMCGLSIYLNWVLVRPYRSRLQGRILLFLFVNTTCSEPIQSRSNVFSLHLQESGLFLTAKEGLMSAIHGTEAETNLE